MKTIDSSDFFYAREAIQNLKLINKEKQANTLLNDLEYIRNFIERTEREITRLNYMAASTKTLPSIRGNIQ